MAINRSPKSPDYINKYNKYDVIYRSITRKKWKMRKEKLSPYFTTKIKGIITIQL
ncbi:MAG: DUF4113 domain-containing protein [Bacteroidia bacterium]|nr:DUF4113 domain-containing protein [Bacteroidia bacterium]